MGLFDRFKKAAAPEPPREPTWPFLVGAPAAGTVVKMEDIPDPVFSQGVLGQCFGVEPADGKIYAPADGKISQLAETLHAVGLECPGGVEVLIHVGVDTVDMKGDGFTARTKEGASVAKGELLLEVDLDKVKAAGHPATVITVVTNSDDFASVELAAEGQVSPGDGVLKVSK